MNSPLPLLAQLEQLHQTYCRLTGQNLSWRFDRERLWLEFLHAGFTLADLTQVVRYLQKEIRHTRRNVGALKLSNLLQLDRFEEDLNISRVRLVARAAAKAADHAGSNWFSGRTRAWSATRLGTTAPTQTNPPLTRLGHWSFPSSKNSKSLTAWSPRPWAERPNSTTVASTRHCWSWSYPSNALTARRTCVCLCPRIIAKSSSCSESLANRRRNSGRDGTIAPPHHTPGLNILDYLDTPCSGFFDYQDTSLPEKREPEQKCRLLLEELESQHGHKEEINLERLSIEHVLPQTLGDDEDGRSWRVALEPDWRKLYEKWVHTLGNLTLTGYNPELGNASYAEKRTAFTQSKVSLNQYFVAVEKWDDQAIRERGLRLARIVAQLWPRPEGGPPYSSARP